jgi:hypothetical protein
LISQQKEIVAPCPYMIFDANGYHKCELMPVVDSEGNNTHCVCAWFYDVCNPPITIEFSIDQKTGKVGSVSTFDLPDSEEYKDMVKRTMTEADVPKLCPRGFTYRQIDAKIAILNGRVQWGNRPIDRS